MLFLPRVLTNVRLYLYSLLTLAVCSVNTLAQTENFFGSTVPETPSATDSKPLELGVRFRAARDGAITGIRFYSASSGTYRARIWNETTRTDLLQPRSATTVTLTISPNDPNPTGWKTIPLATPLRIEGDVPYIVSVNTGDGGLFALTQRAFCTANCTQARAFTSSGTGALATAPTLSNGVFSDAGLLPTNSFLGSNYFRDVNFVPDPLPLPATVRNPTVDENQLRGTTEWLLTDRANGSELLAYATASSINRGEQIGLKISQQSGTAYRVQVFRMGYYNGLGARLYFQANGGNGVRQSACVETDSATNLIRCNWSTRYVITGTTTASWVSGLYTIKITANPGTASEAQTYTWLTVRDDARNADVLFKFASTNYHAYNNLNNNCLYDFCGTRAFAVSYDRPYTQANINIDANSPNHPFAYQLPMLMFLEQQGFNTKYVDNVDMDIDGGEVGTANRLWRRAKLILSSGHDEYWSKRERDNYEAARENGVNLAFFAANTAYWQVRLENSGATPNFNSLATANNNSLNMICYKTSQNRSFVDPIAATRPVEATDLFRAVGRPESQLLGVYYIGDDSANYLGFPLVRSTATDATANRYFANTGITTSGATSRVPGLLGYEWDAAPLASAPEALPPNRTNFTILFDSPVTPRGGGCPPAFPGVPACSPNVAQRSQGVAYTYQNGSIISKTVSLGTIQGSWGLYSRYFPVHQAGGIDGNRAVPDRESNGFRQFGINVFRDLGASPKTLSPGLR